MNRVAFRPLGSRYLVLPDSVTAKTEQIGEYQISERKDVHAKPAEGTVIACGSGCTELKPGDKVLYGTYSGYEQMLDGVKYLVLAESEILGQRLPQD